MNTLDTIKAFLSLHTNLTKEIEAMTVQDALNLIQALYPSDPVLIYILAKISSDFEKLKEMQK